MKKPRRKPAKISSRSMEKKTRGRHNAIRFRREKNATQEKENGRMVERVFYDDKRRTPQDRAEGEANVGAQTFLRLDDGIHAGESPVAYRKSL